jgi:hypothetical protein
MKRALLLLVLAYGTVSLSARADEKAACLEAAGNGQTLRDAHKLIEARDQFRLCARAQCPAVIQQDCATWLEATEKSLPTVVVTAKSDSGGDLFDVKVTSDGQPFVGKLDGSAMAMNPGVHALHFEAAGGASLDQTVLIKEGEKDRAIAVALSSGIPAKGKVTPEASSTPVPSPQPSGASRGAEVPTMTPTTPENSLSPTWRTVGWALGGTGAAAVVLGVAFGIDALAKKGSANCDGNNFCDSAPLSDARGAANISTIGFVAGGVLAAGALAVVLFAPRSGPASSGLRVQMAPAVGLSSAGLDVAGRW